MSKDLAYIKLMLEDMSTIADKVTSGNVSHNIATIKCDARKALECLDSLQEEPVREELEKAADIYGDELDNVLAVCDDNDEDNTIGEYAKEAFKAGAEWQKEQFEMNRLKHCDSITNEQAELEQGFISQHLDKHQRMPTFLDAIEYGINLQK